ncbi:MAG: DUF1015 domain-containing protein [Candidatus Omnitrophota bacterium]|nr:DUF1015 domain-containing protein [Candidatus Omnitrophota bacterium]
MAKIYPFQGIRYHQEKIKDISKVVAPPYDIISREAQENYYNLNNRNIIRLILGKTEPKDNPTNNKYTRAGDFLAEWIRSGILKKEKKASIYLYEQGYTIHRRRYLRKGLIALVRLEDFEDKVILPHELTFSGPKKDRLQLMRATRANLSPIFAFYESDNNTISQTMADYSSRQPIIKLKDNDNIRHKLWAIDCSRDIKKIAVCLKGKSIFIADGHHRYETALNFRNEMKIKSENFTGEEKYNRVMAYLVDINQNVTLLPAHRLIKRSKDINMRKLEEFFLIKMSKMNQLLNRMKEENHRHIFGMYYKKKCYLLVLKNEAMVGNLMDIQEPEVWKKLDVVILHKLLIEHILNVDKKDIGYSTDENKAVGLVDNGEYAIALFLNPVRIEDFKAVTNAHRLMPQKSTYFYPKPLSGLVINKFE